jgi:hypothetical protein
LNLFRTTNFRPLSVFLQSKTKQPPMKKNIKSMLGLALLLVGTGPTSAQSIFINNWDFSSGASTTVFGWDELPNASTPTAAHLQIVAGGPDENGYLSLRGANAAQTPSNFGVAQNTGQSIAAGTYTFSYAFTRVGSAAGMFFDAMLYAGVRTAVVYETNVVIGALTAGEWVTNTVTLVIPPGSPFIGQTLGVHFRPPHGENRGTTIWVAGVDVVSIDFAPDNTPDFLGYAENNARYVVNESIVPNSPVVPVGTPTNFTLTAGPGLPAGLSLDPATGIISGFPTAVTTPPATNIITADFSEGGSDSVEVAIEILAPYLVRYVPSNVTVTAGVAIPNLNPELFGTVMPTNYSVSPALPAGVILDPVSGLVFGTPTEVGTNDYTITAEYELYADSSAPIRLAIVAPQFLGYADTVFILSTNQPMRSATPVVVGTPPTNYLVSPALPAGVTLDASSGVINGTPEVISATTTYTITADYDGYPDVLITIDLRVVDGFADDFNHASGNLSFDPGWTHQLGNTGFGLNGAIVSGSPTGADNLAGPTVTLNASALYPGGDFTVSAQTQFPGGGGVAGGLTFGLVDSQNFWTFQLKNGNQASGGLNSDIFIRHRKDGIVTTILDETGLTNAVGSQWYTLTVRYDADTQRLKFEVRRQNGTLYFTHTHELDPVNDLAIATNSAFGLQTFSSFASQFENFWGSFGPVSIVPEAFNITDIQYDPITGEALITWPSTEDDTYSVLAADTVDGLYTVIAPSVAGNGSDVSYTHAAGLGKDQTYYRVKRN